MRLVPLLLSALPLLAAAQPEGLVLLGDDRHPPYSWLEKGEPRGLYVDAIKLALARAGLQQQPVRWVMEPWRRALRSAENGEGHALFPPHRFPVERPFLSAYSPPLFDEQPVVVCRLAALQAKPRQRWPDDFLDLRFGLSAGVLMGGRDFHALVARGLVRAEASGSVQQNARKLVAGRVDCHINSRYSLAWALAPLNDNAATPLVVAVRLPASGGHLAYVGQPRLPLQPRPDLPAQLNAAFEQLKREGALQRLLDEHRCSGGPPDWAQLVQAQAAAPQR